MFDASLFSPAAQAWLAGCPLDSPGVDSLLATIRQRAARGDSPETIADGLAADALTTCDHFSVGRDDPLHASFLAFVGDLARLTTETAPPSRIAAE